jgi:F-type H+-transporting ATPase subunit b
MRRAALSFWIFVTTGAPFLAEEAEHAAEGAAEHGSGWMEPIWGVPMIAWQIANILLVAGLFVYLLRRPAPKFFEGRAKEIQDLLEKAVREKEEATARLKEVEAKMGHLQDEVASIESAALQQAEGDRHRVQAEAEQARERIRKETKDEIERRLVEARRELKRYAADAAVAAAREVLARDITGEDEGRLRARFLVGVEEEAHERRG